MAKSLLSRKMTKIYLESYLLVLFIIFLFPIIYTFIAEKNVQIFGANVLFFELNLFLSLVLMIYTYFTRFENDNWKIFILYFLLSIAFLVSSMIILGGKIFF